MKDEVNRDKFPTDLELLGEHSIGLEVAGMPAVVAGMRTLGLEEKRRLQPEGGGDFALSPVPDIEEGQHSAGVEAEDLSILEPGEVNSDPSSAAAVDKKRMEPIWKLARTSLSGLRLGTQVEEQSFEEEEWEG
jgi:hypothetical protein